MICIIKPSIIMSFKQINQNNSYWAQFKGSIWSQIWSKCKNLCFSEFFDHYKTYYNNFIERDKKIYIEYYLRGLQGLFLGGKLSTKTQHEVSTARGGSRYNFMWVFLSLSFFCHINSFTEQLWFLNYDLQFTSSCDRNLSWNIVIFETKIFIFRQNCKS